MKKMRGIIDPYTLGFIIALFGSSTAYLVHTNDDEQIQQSKTVVLDSGNKDTESNIDVD